MNQLANSTRFVPRDGARQATVVVGLLVLTFTTSSARGATRDARERAARAACLSGDYVKGVTILSHLFVETEDVNYIYNQGRCFEQNARHQEAIARFQEYLRVGRKLTDDERAEARKHIADCQDSLAGPSRHQPPTPPPALPLVPVPNAPPTTHAPSAPVPLAAAEEPSAEQARHPPLPPPRSPGSALRAAGLVTAVVGGVVLAAGIVLNVKVNSMASDFRTLNGYTDARESDRANYETMGWASYGVGATCLATGALLYGLGLRNGRQGTPAVALLPSPGGATAMVEGAF